MKGNSDTVTKALSDHITKGLPELSGKTSGMGMELAHVVMARELFQGIKLT
jgi:hypothetical protein